MNWLYCKKKLITASRSFTTTINTEWMMLTRCFRGNTPTNLQYKAINFYPTCSGIHFWMVGSYRWCNNIDGRWLLCVWSFRDFSFVCLFVCLFDLDWIMRIIEAKTESSQRRNLWYLQKKKQIIIRERSHTKKTNDCYLWWNCHLKSNQKKFASFGFSHYFIDFFRWEKKLPLSIVYKRERVYSIRVRCFEIREKNERHQKDFYHFSYTEVYFSLKECSDIFFHV